MSRIEDCEVAARLFLKTNASSTNPTEEDVTNAVQQAAMFLNMSDDEIEKVKKIIQSSIHIRMDLGVSIYDQEADHHFWVASRRANIVPYYWERYKKYLEIEQGWNIDVVDRLGEVADAILDQCGNPAEQKAWIRKGLIIGDIQSGKTSNYLALCNKAADAGYKLIILLTGTIEGLRKQTQERVDAGFVGLNSRDMLKKNPQKKFKGVGNIDSNRTAFPFTTVSTDFNSHKLESLNFTIKGMNEPVILVLKKNKRILENLETWLVNFNTDVTGNKISLPMLFIDDEADNASVNTNKPDQSQTAINDAIVKILQLFVHATYIGVTATPFANIFIDPEFDKGNRDSNLFPNDFIYSLSAPTNYIGADRIFGDKAEFNGALEPINDVVLNEETGERIFRSKAKSQHIVPYIPDSLVDAIGYFCLANTVRDLDGYTQSHRSMLVNVTQYVAVQEQIAEKVNIILKKFKQKIQLYSKRGSAIALEHSEIKRLYDIWVNNQMSDKTGYDWNTVLDNLHVAVSPIEVMLVNQKSKVKGKQRLDYDAYENGLRVIAIGGNGLSRGLTLEGLIVSYFDRNSQMYDTLMQMGRWFGYRKGYENLMKIWMEPETINWYKYITRASDEFRDEISEMNRINLTPREFGLKVQQNEVALYVTARNKMRNAEVVENWISISAKVIETPRLVASKDNLKSNLRFTDELLSKLIDEKEKYYKNEFNYHTNRAVFTGVSKEIVADYVSTFRSHPRHLPFNARDISDYIRSSNEFKTWTVALIGGSRKEEMEHQYFSDEVCNLHITYSSRVITKDNNCLLISGQRARAGVPGATACGLRKNEQEDIAEAYKKEHKDVKTIPDKAFLNTKKYLSEADRDPVLLIYVAKIDKDKKKDLPEGKGHREFDSDNEAIELIGDYPVVALGIGFPGDNANSKSRKIKYVMNLVGLRDTLNFEEDEEDEED